MLRAGCKGLHGKIRVMQGKGPLEVDGQAPTAPFMQVAVSLQTPFEEGSQCDQGSNGRRVLRNDWAGKRPLVDLHFLPIRFAIVPFLPLEFVCGTRCIRFQTMASVTGVLQLGFVGRVGKTKGDRVWGHTPAAETIAGAPRNRGCVDQRGRPSCDGKDAAEQTTEPRQLRTRWSATAHKVEQ